MDAYDFRDALRRIYHARQYILNQTQGAIDFQEWHCAVWEDYPLAEAIGLFDEAERELIGEIL